MQKKITKKKLLLNKATVLKFFEANRILGGQMTDCDPYTTCAANCSSKDGRPDSCSVCNTNEHTCPVTCHN